MYIKRRIIDIELKKIVIKPYIKTLPKKAPLCYMRALISLPDTRTFESMLYDACYILVDLIAPPYTLPLWLYLFNKLKLEKTPSEIDFIKLYGYMYKPRKDKIGFYVVDATERKLPKEKRAISKEGDNQLGAYIFNSHNSYYEGEEYLKEKYPLLNNEKNKIRPLMYKASTPNRTYFYKDITAPITLYLFDDNLYKLVNPLQKEELKGKPLFYQLLDTLADSPSIAEELGGRGGTIKVLLKRYTFKAQKPKSPKAQRHKETPEEE